MKVIMTVGLLILMPLISVLGQEKQNQIILRKGQKIFLERGDYLNDKIYGITDKVDTVEVILADKSFYKFKKADFEAWAITNQIDESTEILGKESEIVYPFNVKLEKVMTVYKEGKLGADKMLDIKKGQTIKVNSKSGYFYQIEFDGKLGYAHISTIVEPAKTHYHIMRAIFDEFHNKPTAQSNESYIRSSGKFISKYQSSGYSSETYKIGNTYYTITTYNGKTEISSYTTGY